MGDFGLLPAEELAANHRPPAPPPKYSEALEVYIARQMSENRWKRTTLPDHRNRLETFLAIIGDKPLGDIQRDDLLSLRDILRRLPPRWNRDAKFKGKTPAEIAALSQKATLNVKTINENMRAIGSFLAWCVREGILERNPAEGLQIKDERSAVDQKYPFSIEELIGIFSHSKFSEGKFKSSGYYWIPVIALYTGMRLEEIAQLHISDIYEKDGVWIIDINTRTDVSGGDTKNLKTKSAARWVPIHAVLIEIGLLKYHREAPKKGTKRLFADLGLIRK